jgi:hypothetical protein
VYGTKNYDRVLHSLNSENPTAHGQLKVINSKKKEAHVILSSPAFRKEIGHYPGRH